MSAIGGVTSGVEQFLQNNSMDISGARNEGKKDETQGVTSTDFESALAATQDREREPSNELTFEDMLQLMVMQLQNQTIDSTADPNDMMNQLISMTVMQSLTTLTTAVEEVQTASVMSYAASLVGKEVTLGIYDEKGNVQEVYGMVEASGTYDGKQVVFVDGQSYFLSSIMAVGKLPPIDSESPDISIDGSGEDGENEDVENSGAAGNVDEGDSEDGGTETGGGVDAAEGAAQAE